MSAYIQTNSYKEAVMTNQKLINGIKQLVHILLQNYYYYLK